jgi:hypothetical protein
MSDQPLHILHAEVAISFGGQENRIYKETVIKII